MNLKVALLQLLPTDTTAGNLSKGVSFCRMAKVQGADVALFPEMWSIGFTTVPLKYGSGKPFRKTTGS